MTKLKNRKEGQRFQIVLFAVQRQSSSSPPDGRCYYTQTLTQCSAIVLVPLHTIIYQTLYHLLYFYVQLYILCTLTTIATSTQNHWATMVRRTKSVQTGTQCVCTWYSTKTLVLLFSPCSLKYVTKPKPCQIHIWLHSFVGQYFTFLTFQIER